MSLVTYNLTSQPPSGLDKPFAISAKPGVDKWRSPPTHFASTAPIIALRVPADTFKSVEVSVKFQVTDLYDQAGLILQFPDQDDPKWIKAGVEMNQQPFLSVVATQAWSDWSLTPLTASPNGQSSQTHDIDVTLRLERVIKDGVAKSAVWIHRVWPDGTTQPLRETTWALQGTTAQTLEVGVYVACPSVTRNQDLTAEFRDFRITSIGEL